MKRILSLLLCLALIAGLTNAVSAAPTDAAASGDDGSVFINIYLDPESEYPVASAEYQYGEIPVRPADPGNQNPGLTFVDWYTSPAFSIRFDFSVPLYEDADIYARFAPTEDVIGVNVFASPSSDYPMYGYLSVKGDLISYPPSPEVEEDYAFIGWYSDRALTNTVDFSQPVYDYLYLFPRIVPLSDLCYGDLYFDVDALEPVFSYMIVKGEPCPVPAEPGKDDMEFDGWYFDRTLTKPIDFTKPMYADFELFPKFSPIHHHNLQMVETVYATAVTDGMKAHYICTECGKWFEPIETALIEIDDHDSLIIPARGPYLLGDADTDGTVASPDVTRIQRKVSRLNTSKFCAGAADVDGDGDVAIIDATYVQRYLARLDVPYLIGVAKIPITT